MKLKFTPRATYDLERLRAFIAEHNPDAAQRVSQQLKHNILHLVKNPKLGKVVDELPRVRYTVIEQTVIILKIWHGKEDQG